MLLVCGKQSGTMTMTPQMLSATFAQLISVIENETDVSFLASLYKCFTDCVRVIGGPENLSPEFRESVLVATRNQLQGIAEKRRSRVNRSRSQKDAVVTQAGAGGDMEDDDDREEMALLEELEDYALTEMAAMLRYFDPNHPLLIAIGSVKELSCNLNYSDEDWESSDAD